MRFISKTPQKKLTAIKPIQKAVITTNGTMQTHTEDFGYIVRFKPHGLTAWEMDECRSRWAADYVDKVPRGGRLENKFGYFDSEEAQLYGNIDSDERREQVEQGILNAPRYGADFVMVERPALTPPWPSYDELVTASGVTHAKVAEKVIAIMVSTGVDPDYVVAYEHANLNRQQLIDAVVAHVNSGDVTEGAVKVPA